MRRTKDITTTGTDGLSRALTAKEAAERLSVSEDMVWKLISRRQLGSFRVGRARRIPVAELDAYAARTFQASRGLARAS